MTQKYYSSQSTLYIILGIVGLISGLAIGHGIIMTVGIINIVLGIVRRVKPVAVLHDDHAMFQLAPLASAQHVHQSAITDVERVDLGYWKGGDSLSISHTDGKDIVISKKLVGEAAFQSIEETIQQWQMS